LKIDIIMGGQQRSPLLDEVYKQERAKRQQEEKSKSSSKNK